MSKRSEIARRAARDLPDGAYVNLGAGLPTLVADHLTDDKEIQFHSENGLLGIAPAVDDANHYGLMNANIQRVSLLQGGSVFKHSDAFVMIRGGHIDYALLGAYQVSEAGDLANWSTGDTSRAPSVGGAMDLAVGAREVWVLMEHCTRTGAPRIVESCTLPLTAARCVSRIYTDKAVIEVRANGLVVTELIGTDFAALQALTAAPLREGF
ncbi:MAG: 3-oxoacid CoA-transferase subunit B [Proteobacteria bacterium]|nr:3-oxoacid CoA-transferase subunit B [Pseudomonadota bacterium]